MGRRWVFRRTQWAVDSPIFAGEIRSVAASIHVFVASQHGRILDFMRWDLAKCEKTGCCLPRIWIPNAQAKLQKNIARVRRQRKMTFDWRP